MFETRDLNSDSNTGVATTNNLASDLLNVRSNICNTFIIVAAIVSLPVLISSLLRIEQIGWQPVMIFHVIVVLSVFFIMFLRIKIPYKIKAGYIITMLFLLGVSGLIQFGMIAGSTVFLVAASPMATLLFGGRIGLAVLAVSIGSTIILAYLIVSGYLVHDVNLATYVVTPLNWLGKIMAWFIVSLAISASIHVFNGKLIYSLKLSEKHQKDLKLHQANLEKIVEERTAELRSSNKNLERFARIAAHDMKSPLNAIACHAQLLDLDSDHNLDEESKDHIKNILDSSFLVSSMINDLLDYSRINSEEIIFNKVDMNVVLEKTLNQLMTELNESTAYITHDELPVVEAVEVQIIRVMQNILANAIKYRDKEKTPSIHVSARRNKDMWTFSISDNGIGISDEQSEKIFDIFHQVDKSDKYEGSGIGLASCKKIIERHDGKIWVESEPGKGSTFFFTLKASD